MEGALTGKSRWLAWLGIRAIGPAAATNPALTSTTAAAMLQGLVASQRLASSRGLSVTPTLLDVGANLGWYTLVASRAGFPAVAFEPMPSNRQLLAASALCLNPDVAGRIRWEHASKYRGRITCHTTRDCM